IRRAHRALAPHVSVSLHCELADILNAYTRLVAQDRSLAGLRAYSAARPPHAEGLAVWIAAYLAHEAESHNVNLLHLSSRKALEAALTMARVFPHVSFKREVTVGHLLLDVDAPAGTYAKVNPPIRPRDDVEFLWRAVLALLDPERRVTVRAAESPSAQGYTPFEGRELTGQVTATFLRGRLAWDNGRVVGAARGRYIRRPA